MGMFEVTVSLANLSTPEQLSEISLLVDTGATLSWVPREFLEKLGAQPYTRLPFEVADGRTLEREVTVVLMVVNGRKAPVDVAFAEPGEAVVMGATALEVLGLLVDPVAQKLIPRNLRQLGLQ